MESLKKFQNMSLRNFNGLYGGMDKLTTELKNEKDEVQYTDVHHDEDNDGVWSAGDHFTITKPK
jgi:hypothetical protein